MSPVLRYISAFDNGKLTSASGIVATASGVFPTHRYEYQQEQPLVASKVQLTGADYMYDQLDGAASIKGNGVERVRFLDIGGAAGDINDDIDLWKSMQTYGRGRIWSQVAPGSGLRWAWARLESMPSLSFTAEDASVIYPVFLTFDRSSDWFAADPIGTDGEFTLDADPDTIVVTNPGVVPVSNAKITVKGPFSGLRITNSTTGYVIETTSTGAGSSDWIRFDAGRNTVEISADSGATWTDDSANFVRADGQVALMVFAAGANSLTIEGANGADVVIEMYGAWP